MRNRSDKEVLYALVPISRRRNITGRIFEFFDTHHLTSILLLRFFFSLHLFCFYISIAEGGEFQLPWVHGKIAHDNRCKGFKPINNTDTHISTNVWDR